MDDLHVKYMTQKLHRVDENIDSLHELMRQQIEINAKNTAILEEHQRRSLANEEQLEEMKRQSYMVQGAVAFISFLALLVSIYVGLK